MTKTQNTLSLAQRYEKNPVLRALVQLVPFGIGSALDAGLETQLNNIRQDRLRCFFDELGSGNLELSEELIGTEDFLHCYFATLRAVTNTRRREKIQFFAHLLRGGIISNIILDVDEYEELLATIDDISYREMCMLDIIEKHTPALMAAFKPWQEEKCLKIWESCKEELVSRTGLTTDEVRSPIRRLDRTGLVEFLFGTHNLLIDDAAVSASSRYMKLKAVTTTEGNQSY